MAFKNFTARSVKCEMVVSVRLQRTVPKRFIGCPYQVLLKYPLRLIERRADWLAFAAPAGHTRRVTNKNHSVSHVNIHINADTYKKYPVPSCITALLIIFHPLLISFSFFFL